MARGAFQVAAHESRRYLALFNKNLLPFVLLLIVVGLIAGPRLVSRGIHPDAGLYIVEINPESLYLPVVRSDPTFTLREGFGGAFQSGEADLLVAGNDIFFDPASDKSRAAVDQLQAATRRWLDSALAGEGDQGAAFPVRVNLVYQPRHLAAPTTSPTPTGAQTTTATAQPTANQSGLAQIEGDLYLDLRPNEVEPPFPVRSLLLTFAYLIPLNFLSQYYATSLYAERVRQRGILLLSTPFSGGEILTGKTLPYLAAGLAFCAAITVLIGSDLLGFAAVLPIIAFAIGSAMLIALIARSPRELTFLLVTVTVLLSTFLFLPAIFTDIHPVAYLSPVTVLSQTIRHHPVPPGYFLYATLPLALVSLVLTRVAGSLYREEQLFAPKPVLSKLADAIHSLAPGGWRLLVAGALTVPFTIGLELFVLVFAVSLDLQLAFVVFLFGGALIEELLKFLVVRARLTHAPRRFRDAILTGLLVGTGFFLGEKLALVFSLIGLDRLPLGDQALASYGVSAVPLLFLGPLLLHVATATVGALGARKGGTSGSLALFAAVLVHAAYNIAVIWFHLGGTR